MRITRGLNFLLTIHLNFLSSQAIVYGYLVPVIFLLAFGSVFRAGSPPLLAQMGQIITITTTLAQQPVAGVTAALTSLTKGGLNSVTRGLAIEYAAAKMRER